MERKRNTYTILIGITEAKRLSGRHRTRWEEHINPLNAELNPICHLLALLGAHRILHVSRIRVNIASKTKRVG
jgi:hypothetical protein